MTLEKVHSAPKRDWGETCALFLCVVLLATLRNRYTFGPPSVNVALTGLLTVEFLLSFLLTIRGDRKATRAVIQVNAFILAVAVALSVAKVVYLVVFQAAAIDPIRLIQTAILIWVGDVIIFAILYHELGEREFAFPQPADQAAPQPMTFLDYVFLSFTTATAFSPTDTAPLSTQARMFMMVESIIALLTVSVVAARAVNILPQSKG
jgi:hypothetical protein